MSTRDVRATPRRHTRNPRHSKSALDVDLNAVPVSENADQEGTSAHGGSQNVQAGLQRSSVPSVAIDLEAFDDDVIISSSSAFAEAKTNSRKNRGRTVVVDVDSEEQSSRLTLNNRNKRSRVSANQTIINCDYYINLEGSSNSMRENVQSMAPPPLPPPPPPKEHIFNCAICLGPLVEEVSTKCGHIFCKACIKAAISSQSKCPTCRRKVTMKDTIRIYLSAAS
ncbi:unnamed protein product [Ilex paraguariensis]|uniref:RING-type domain-containing protein n=1 Tax=Ilex paraguariensis TaxID=185542 RepID=A0ABC8R7F5_9AQUA